MPTQVILSQSHSTLGNLYLDWQPQPGAYLEIEGETYIVLERRHRYHLKSGLYQLHKIVLCVQKSQPPAEKSLLEGKWVIGNITCTYNARSELFRCAVNPSGPCDGCVDYRPIRNKKA